MSPSIVLLQLEALGVNEETSSALKELVATASSAIEAAKAARTPQPGAEEGDDAAAEETTEVDASAAQE